MPDHGVTVRYDDPTFAALQLEAQSRHLSLAEVVRGAVGEHLARQTLARALPLLDAAFGKHVDRLAGLLAKAFVAAGMASWQARALIAALVPDQDAAAVMRQARLRALADLRRPGTEFGTESDLYAEDTAPAGDGEG